MNFKKTIALLITLQIIIFSTACGNSKPVQGAAPAIAKEGKTIFLHTNDTHGKMLASETAVGISAISALKARYEAQGANVVLLDAGDTFHGSAFATLDKGEGILELMKLAGYDAMTPGNHDFNYGSDALTHLSFKAPFPILSANLVQRGSEKKLLDGYAVIQRENIKIGIFGLCTPETVSKANPENVRDIEVYDPYQAAAEAVSVLKAAEVDYIVALCHLGLNSGSQFTSEGVARSIAGIDLIIDGHSHTELEQGKRIGNTLIASAGEHLNAVGMVTLDHATRDVIAELIRVDDPRVQGLSDAAVDARIYEIETKQQGILSEVVGNTPVMLNGRFEDVRTKETNLGNLVTDAMRDATGAQIALINGGALRDSIVEGDITKGDVLNVMPFGNYIVTKQLNGANLRAALESSVKAYPEDYGGFLQVSGISFVFDPAASPGGRIKDIQVGGKPLDITAEYLVAVNDFIATGGDNYAMFAKAKAISEFSTLDQTLIAYINKLTAMGEKLPEAGERIRQYRPMLSESPSEQTVNQPVEKPDDSGQALPVAEPAPEQPEKIPDPQELPQGEQSDDNSETYYVVDYDDNIWNIAKEQLGDVNLWDELLEENKDIIQHPDQIYVGQRLRLPKKAS